MLTLLLFTPLVYVCGVGLMYSAQAEPEYPFMKEGLWLLAILAFAVTGATSAFFYPSPGYEYFWGAAVALGWLISLTPLIKGAFRETFAGLARLDYLAWLAAIFLCGAMYLDLHKMISR